MNANLPFTRDQFMGMFGAYNEAIWPLQVVAYVLGFTAVAVVIWRWRQSDRVVTGVLAAMWLWIGSVFMWTFMRTIDSGPGPLAFTVAFLVEGILFLLLGVLRSDLRFELQINKLSVFGVVGGLLIVYAMLIYPLLGLLNGHVYPRQPVFGVAPCPTVIFTFGLLLLTTVRVPKRLLVVPFLWSVTSGISAPLNYGVYEDLGLVVAGLVATTMLMVRDARRAPRAALQPRPA
jgi:uncharacterized protein DUF6064